MKTISILGQSFTKRHDWLLNQAKASGVALCGGCAAAVVKARTDYEPKDIDFATNKEGAIKLIGKINTFLLKKSTHFRIYANSRNAFVPSQADAHFRITCSFWLPICIFVLPDDKFRFYRIQKGHMLQFYEDIKQAADELTEIDNKLRIASLIDERDAEGPIGGLLESTPSRVGSGRE